MESTQWSCIILSFRIENGQNYWHSSLLNVLKFPVDEGILQMLSFDPFQKLKVTDRDLYGKNWAFTLELKSVNSLRNVIFGSIIYTSVAKNSDGMLEIDNFLLFAHVQVRDYHLRLW